MAKTRVFVSFDFDSDHKLKTFHPRPSQEPDSPFEIENWSLNEPAPQRSWQEKAGQRIARCDVILAIAAELGIPVRQVIDYRGSSPNPVPGASIAGAGRC